MSSALLKPVVTFIACLVLRSIIQKPQAEYLLNANIGQFIALPLTAARKQ